MAFWPVIHHDGSLQATDERGDAHAITMAGQPVRSLNPGWSPLGLQTGLAPLYLLELRHEAAWQPDAVWYLSGSLGGSLGGGLEFLANHASRLPPADSERLIEQLMPLLRDLHETTLCGPRATTAPAAHPFQGINPAFVLELIGHVTAQALTPPDCVSVEALSGLSDHYMSDGVRLSLPSLAVLLAASEQNADAALAPLELASPLGGGALLAQERLALQDPAAPAASGRLRADRFFDPRVGLSFYLMQPPDRQHACLFVPGLNLAFARGEPPPGRDLLTVLLAHAASRIAGARPRTAVADAATGAGGGPGRVPPRPAWTLPVGSGAA